MVGTIQHPSPIRYIPSSTRILPSHGLWLMARGTSHPPQPPTPPPNLVHETLVNPALHQCSNVGGSQTARQSSANEMVNDSTHAWSESGGSASARGRRRENLVTFRTALIGRLVHHLHTVDGYLPLISTWSVIECRRVVAVHIRNWLRLCTIVRFRKA